jgi:hypothetical protein
MALWDKWANSFVKDLDKIKLLSVNKLLKNIKLQLAITTNKNSMDEANFKKVNIVFAWYIIEFYCS